MEALLREQLGVSGGHEIAGVGSRLGLWRAIVLHGIPAARGRELSWVLEETAAVNASQQRLWQACLDAVERAGAGPAPSVVVPVRHADLLNTACAIDTDAWIHPPLIRFLAGYLDQGLAHWPMPDRDRAIHGCFIELYHTPLAAQCGAWARTLPSIADDDRRVGRTALDSIAYSLAELGVAEEECDAYLSAELLALRGWAGIVRQIEERPDRVPARDLTVTLRGYLAVRLLFERAALVYAAKQAGFDGPLSSLRPWLRLRLPRSTVPTAIERAWPLFHVAQLCGIDAPIAEQWTAANVADLESELQDLDELRQRRILHQAFERTIRYRLYDALIGHAPRTSAAPAFQAIFCLDEREESFRRHLEEVAPDCETFGTAGFFNVAMYHQGVTDAHPRPLCPVAIRPDHYVAESRAGRRSIREPLAPLPPARHRVPRLQRASGKPAARPRRRPDDGVRLACARPADPARRVSLAVIALATRAENDDRRGADPPAAGPRGRRTADRHLCRLHRARDGDHRAPHARGRRDSRSAVAAGARDRTRIGQPEQPARVGPRLRRLRGRTRRAERAGLRADGQRPTRASASWQPKDCRSAPRRGSWARSATPATTR